MGQRSFFVPLDGAPNGSSMPLEELFERLGPGPWRAPLVGAPHLRVVVHSWLPGHTTVPHYHPGGHEIFLVLRGTAGFTSEMGRRSSRGRRWCSRPRPACATPSGSWGTSRC
jgi:uncharacterized protein YjlB